MRRYPPAAMALIGVTVAVATAFVWLSIQRDGLSAHHLPQFLVLTGFAGFTQLYPVRSVRGQSSYSLCNIFVFAAVLLLPLSWATLLCLAIWVPTLPQRYRSGDPYFWVPPLTNAAQLVVLVHLTGQILRYTGAYRLSGLPDVVWLFAAAVVFVLAQTVFVSVLVALYRRVPLQSLDLVHVDSFLSDLFLPCLGVVVAVLWTVHPSLLMVAGIALALAYRMMRGIQLIRQAELDPKTGIYNFRYFEEQLKLEVNRALGLRRPLSLIFADLDYLRTINNSFGHQAGDAAIHRVAGIFQSLGGKLGLPARFGGEEFVLLLPGVDSHEALYLAERLRVAVEEARIPVGTQVISCTMSFGVATCPTDGTTTEALVKAADQAVYAAKSGGRNRVCVATDPGQANACAQALAESATALASQAVQQSAAARQEEEAVEPGASQGQHMPPAGQALTVAALMAGTIVLAWSVSDLQQGTNWWALIMLAASAGMAQALKVNMFIDDGTRGSMSICMAITMATGAYLGVAAAVVVNLVSGVVQVWGAYRREVHKLAFNLCMAVLSAAAGALPYAWLRHHQTSVGLGLAGYAATGAGAVLYYLTNIGLMSLLMAWAGGQSPLAVWRKSMAFVTPHYFSLTLAGGFLGYFQPVLGWTGTLTLVILLLLIRRSFQQQVRHMHTSLRALQEAKELLSRANQLEKKNMRELTEAVSAIIDARDASVFGHSRQVARYAVAIAGELGITDAVLLDEIRTAALLHDLGKVGVPEAILHKPGRLTPEEYAIIQQHAYLGERILSQVGSLKQVALIVGNHHEYWDGSGYPRGAAGEAIPIGARIVSAADTLDSILTDRPYSRARSLDVALGELRRCAGTQFDPTVVAAIDRLTASWPAHYFQNSFPSTGVLPVVIPNQAAEDVTGEAAP